MSFQESHGQFEVNYSEGTKNYLLQGQDDDFSLAELERQEKITETKMDFLLKYLMNRLEDVRDELLREKLRRLLVEIPKKICDYVDARRGLVLASRRMSYDDSEKYRNATMNADRVRNLAHNALLDALRIAFRNIIKNTPESGTPPSVVRELIDERRGDYRDFVGREAIKYLGRLIALENQPEESPAMEERKSL